MLPVLETPRLLLYELAPGDLDFVAAMLADPVGLALQEVDGKRRPEGGWLLAREYWGRGYATEAEAGVRAAGFERRQYPSAEVQFHGFRHIVYRSLPPA